MPPRKQVSTARRTQKTQSKASAYDLLIAGGLEVEDASELTKVKMRDGQLAFDTSDLNSFLEFTKLAKDSGYANTRRYLEEQPNRRTALRQSPTLAVPRERVKELQDYERGEAAGIQTEDPCPKEGCKGCLIMYKQQRRARDEATDVFFRCGICLEKVRS